LELDIIQQNKKEDLRQGILALVAPGNNREEQKAKHRQL